MNEFERLRNTAEVRADQVERLRDDQVRVAENALTRSMPPGLVGAQSRRMAEGVVDALNAHQAAKQGAVVPEVERLRAELERVATLGDTWAGGVARRALEGR